MLINNPLQIYEEYSLLPFKITEVWVT